MNPDLATLSVGDELPTRTHTPTNAELFFYNAALWNAHRIHYDLPYAQNEEGYDGLVIAGPQMGDWMTQVVDNWIAETDPAQQAWLAGLDYSNRAAAYIGETLTTGGTITAIEPDAESPDKKRRITIELFVKNAAGDVITPGQAVVTCRNQKAGQ